MTKAVAITLAIASGFILPVQPGLFVTGSADGGASEQEYVPHAPIRILNDSQFCVPDGSGGWLDTGVVNCDTADGSRPSPYVVSGWSIDMHNARGLEGIAIRIEKVSKSFVVSNNYLYNGSRFVWNASSAISLRVISNDQLVPSDVTSAGQIVRVDRNVVSSFQTGLRLGNAVGGIISARTGQTFRFVTNNTFHETEQSVFVFIPSTFEHNAFLNSSIVAIWQSDAMANYVLRANDIRNTPIGFSLDPCPFLFADVRPVVEYNNFVNVTEWAVFQRGCTDVVLAPNNYWGHASGPSYRRLQDGTVDPILDSLGVPDFFGGQGGRVTYGVLFAPWRLEENPDAGPMPAS